VGRVIGIKRNPGANFIDVEVEPAAEMDRSKYLLLVFTSKDGTTIGNSQ
jgi:cell shape-determining protein MreC